MAIQTSATHLVALSTRNSFCLHVVLPLLSYSNPNTVHFIWTLLWWVMWPTTENAVRQDIQTALCGSSQQVDFKENKSSPEYDKPWTNSAHVVTFKTFLCHGKQQNGIPWLKYCPWITQHDISYLPNTLPTIHKSTEVKTMLPDQTWGLSHFSSYFLSEVTPSYLYCNKSSAIGQLENGGSKLSNLFF